METTIKTYQYDNGEIQRVRVIKADSFDELSFFSTKKSVRAFGVIENLYRNFIVPKCPWIFGQMILYHVPEELSKEIMGDEADEAKLCALLRKKVRVRKSSLVFKDAQAKAICEKLIDAGYFAVISGALPHTKILPVGDSLGFLSESEPDARVKVNSNFFIMDCFDVASIYDRIGTPIGLMLKDGVIFNPPAYDREALLVHENGRVEIRNLSLNELTVQIGGRSYRHAVNAKIYERPKTCNIMKTPVHGRDLFVVITGTKVVDVCENGGCRVPGSGFVLRIPKDEIAGTEIHVGDEVTYKGLENVKFGVQIGNSIVINGKKTERFISKFYNIYRGLGARAYPPSLYPLDFMKARAARTAIGATVEGKPCIFWAEGSKKTGYVKGEQSRGATLNDMADIASDLGLYNAVNLDGGGSAQILVDNRRELIISDRNPSDDTDAERVIPSGIRIS